MTYKDIINTIPQKRPFFVKAIDGVGLSSGILLAIENDNTNYDWVHAINIALYRFENEDYGNFYNDEEVLILKGHEYGNYPSPFGDSVQEGSIVIHAETYFDSFGKAYDKVVFFWYER